MRESTQSIYQWASEEFGTQDDAYSLLTRAREEFEELVRGVRAWNGEAEVAQNIVKECADVAIVVCRAMPELDIISEVPEYEIVPWAPSESMRSHLNRTDHALALARVVADQGSLTPDLIRGIMVRLAWIAAYFERKLSVEIDRVMEQNRGRTWVKSGDRWLAGKKIDRMEADDCRRYFLDLCSLAGLKDRTIDECANALASIIESAPITNGTATLHDLVARDIIDRKRLGNKRYKGYLTPGQPGMLDGALDELLGAVVYLRQRKAQIQGEAGAIWDMVVADCRAHDADGFARYETRLTESENGRKALVDAYQEILDAAVNVRDLVHQDGLTVEDQPDPRDALP